MRGRKFEEGGGGSPPSSPQGISVVKQHKRKERAFLAPPQEAGPLRTSLYELFRDLGSGRPPPAGLTLNLVTIQAEPAFGSKGVTPRESAADIYPGRLRTDDASRGRALIPGGLPPDERTAVHPRAPDCSRFRRHH